MADFLLLFLWNHFSNIKMKLFSKKRLPLLYNKELYK